MHDRNLKRAPYGDLFIYARYERDAPLWRRQIKRDARRFSRRSKTGFIAESLEAGRVVMSALRFTADPRPNRVAYDTGPHLTPCCVENGRRLRDAQDNWLRAYLGEPLAPDMIPHRCSTLLAS